MQPNTHRYPITALYSVTVFASAAEAQAAGAPIRTWGPRQPWYDANATGPGFVPQQYAMAYNTFSRTLYPNIEVPQVLAAACCFAETPATFQNSYIPVRPLLPNEQLEELAGGGNLFGNDPMRYVIRTDLNPDNTPIASAPAGALASGGSAAGIDVTAILSALAQLGGKFDAIMRRIGL